MSDSDDSDFGAQREKMRNKVRRTTPLVNRQNSYSVGNDESDDDDEADLILTSSKSNKRKNISVDQKMAKLEHNKKIQQRKRQNWLKAKDDSSSDDDSEDEEPPVVVQETVRPPHATPQSSPRHYTSSKPPSGGSRRSARLQSRQARTAAAPKQGRARRPPPIPKAPPNEVAAKPSAQEEIEISSDEETTISVSTENNMQLMQLRQARAQLMAQQPDPSEECEVLEVIESPRNKIIKIIVDATIDRNGTKSECDSITLDVPVEEKLAVLEQSILRELNLPSDSYCILRCGTKQLRGDQTAAFYDLELKTNVHASIFVTTWGSKSKSSSATAQNFGPSLQLILRKGETRTTVSYGLNQPFKKLIDDHGVLQFDGERVSPTSTPASYDMESEDLIEIL